MADSTEPERSIANLPRLIEALPHAERTLVRRLFDVVEDAGEIVSPPELVPWLERTFGSLQAVRQQHVVRVTNRWTFEGTTFNTLRARRPGAGVTNDPKRMAEVRARIEAARGDDFCLPEQRTPADTFGRVYGRYCRTAANVARADGWHGVVILDEHNPLAVTPAQITDALLVARAWAWRARELDPRARHLFVLWNCLWRAGASLVHSHMQMTLSKAMAHARVELWRAAARRYTYETGGSYFADLLTAHQALGLAIWPGSASAFASLTPLKEREVVLLAPSHCWTTTSRDEATGALEDLLAGPVARLIEGMRQTGVVAFNAAIFGPPLEQHDGDWSDFPTIARLLDRGDPLSATADVAAMELFASSVVASDPFAVARQLAG